MDLAALIPAWSLQARLKGFWQYLWPMGGFLCSLFLFGTASPGSVFLLYDTRSPPSLWGKGPCWWLLCHRSFLVHGR